MKTIRISGLSARLRQGMYLLFFVPYTFFLSYLILSENFTGKGIVFLVAFLAVISFILKLSFSYADIYLVGNQIIIKKLFTVRKINREEINVVKESILPFTYYLRVGQSKIYFLPSKDILIKRLLSMDPNKGLMLIKKRLGENPS